MFNSTILFVSALTLAMASPSLAQRYDDGPGSFISLRLPDDWVLDSTNRIDTNYHPKDNSYQIRRGDSSHPNTPWTAVEVEKFVVARLNDRIGQSAATMHPIMAQATVDTHARPVHWGEFVGFEVLGDGSVSGKPGKWFGAVVWRHGNPRVRCWLLGTGTIDGFKQNHPIAYEAVRKLRWIIY